MKSKFLIVLFITGAFLYNGNVNAQNEKVHTAFIFQLTRLIDWCQDGKQGNFTIAVYGEDAKLLAELQSLQGRKVVDQTIVVKKFTNLSEVEKANIIFVSKTKIDEMSNVIAKLGSSCSLVISDKAGAAKQGAAISFIDVDGKIQFEINKSYADRYSLKVNDQLIKLAKNVF
jgi:hypothetical protein